MCQAIDKIREDSRDEGRKEGQKEMAVKLLKKGTMSLQEIAELVELPISELKVIQHNLLQNA